MPSDNKIHLLIVEPHADDAYLSLHEHILRWRLGGYAITILTVQSAVENRAEEAKAYAGAVGVEWAGLGYDYGALPDEIDLSPYDPTLIVGPFGIQHPDHIRIREILHPDLLYFDIPYYRKQKNQAALNEQFTNLELHSLYTPSPSKRHKKYWGCFTSQNKFFYFNPPRELARIPEILVAPLNLQH